MLEHVRPRARVIVDNDFSGDLDDLWQLAHHVLSPSVEIPFVIGSHLAPNDGFDSSDHQAANAVTVATDLLERVGRADIPVVQGAELALVSPTEPRDSAAARAIIAEALRDDTDLPLYFAAGAGMTDLASALLLEPSIAARITLVWIGGNEHPGIGTPPPGASAVEYNLNIDVQGARTVFATPDLAIWQVPRDAYRRVLMSFAEIDARVRPLGPLGEYLASSLDAVASRVLEFGLNIGETYVLGDSPLVLLTALQSSFEADPSSSDYVLVPRPQLGDDGQYRPPLEGAGTIRVYTHLDLRLLIDDLVAKLQLHALAHPATSTEDRKADR
ncbi:inosine-uridine nucleoside N-ribohydrolase [Frondihabitans sp. PhB188]|uniref:nucleoside hydrolase n=1 Tax=Frondihabitans sp. PhB188 TaxID=2485200 RepID=UPI000F478A0B|nr:nucleoside hydrolase [Frondihabitans sp. PhB188]ROQ41499.1 inosine-uridine nucleoside N-ribohydrolase [Frondihabitans sp. PhB188]